MHGGLRSLAVVVFTVAGCGVAFDSARKQMTDKLGVSRSTIGKWRVDCTGPIHPRRPTEKSRPLHEVQYEKRSFAIDIEQCPAAPDA
jgi:hypothetical protein